MPNFSGFDLIFFMGIGTTVASIYLFSLFMTGSIGISCKACSSMRTYSVTNPRTYETYVHCVACANRQRKKRENDRIASIQALRSENTNRVTFG